MRVVLQNAGCGFSAPAAFRHRQEQRASRGSGAMTSGNDMSEQAADITSCVLTVFKTRSSDLVTNVLAAEAIAADARFNLWFLNTAKREKGPDGLLQLVEFYDGLAVECCAAVEAFHDSRKRTELRQVLAEITRKLKEVTA